MITGGFLSTFQKPRKFLLWFYVTSVHVSLYIYIIYIIRTVSTDYKTDLSILFSSIRFSSFNSHVSCYFLCVNLWLGSITVYMYTKICNSVSDVMIHWSKFLLAFRHFPCSFCHWLSKSTSVFCCTSQQYCTWNVPSCFY